MKKLLLITAMMVLAAPLYAQEDSIDVTNILNGLGGGNNNGRGGRGNQPQIPVALDMLTEIKTALKNGKTPLVDKAQEKQVQSLLNTEIVALTDQIQVLRGNDSNNQNNQNNQGGRGRGGTPQNNTQNNQQNQPSQTAITVET